MSEQIKDGGPAFPVPDVINHERNYYKYGSDGLTIRDYFAAKELGKTDGTAICERPEVYARIADHCYRMADAMLAAREVQS